MWSDMGFRAELERGSMTGYEKIMLSSGQCSFFMPMGFMSCDEGDIAHYDCSGFVPISRYRIEKTDDVLYILEQTLIIIERAVEFLITPRKILITADTVFYSRETGEVKMTYIPAGIGQDDLRKNIESFIAQISCDIKDGGECYVDTLSEYISRHNYYIRDIINRIGMLRRRLYLEKHGDLM